MQGLAEFMSLARAKLLMFIRQGAKHTTKLKSAHRPVAGESDESGKMDGQKFALLSSPLSPGAYAFAESHC